MAGFQVDTTMVLGDGVFATVYKARDTDRGIDLAVKVYNADFGGYEQQLHQCRTEFAFLQKLEHPNIIRVLGVGDGGPGHPVSLIMAYAPSGDLHGLVSDVAGVGVRPDAATSIIRGLAEALAYLHTEHALIHGDLKPENILLDGDTPKLCDFDAALRFGTPMAEPRGTMAYHPPEYPAVRTELDLAGEEAPPLVASGAADMWAITMVVLMVVTGCEPETVAAPGEGLFWRWAGPLGGKRRNPWPHFEPTLRSVFVDVLCQPDPENRLTAEALAARVGNSAVLQDEIRVFRAPWARTAAADPQGLMSPLSPGGGDDRPLISPEPAPALGPVGLALSAVEGACTRLREMTSESCAVM
mmetsp:Transcript_21165/g.55109  ORF Transcript_21165/g.55109 Transcript_21165/m.55109 type:complete len:356 (+) Transcript_21165:215-1282(+)